MEYDQAITLVYITGKKNWIDFGLSTENPVVL